MRLLHTGDWHVGKVLKGVARLPEQREVLAEVVEVASERAVDLVVVAGDLFESSAPSAEAQELVWRTLLALRATGAEVVVVAGNHDSTDLFEAVRPVFAEAGITVVGRTRPPQSGGVVELRARSTGEPVRVALLPFCSQRGAVRAAQLLELDAAQATQAYAERMAGLVSALTAGFRSDAVNVLVAHATVVGAKLGGGERDAQTVFEYHVPAAIFPSTASYVALGHLHRAQRVDPILPIWYSGSPFAIDFGEGGDVKGVVVVDATPGAPATVTTVPIRAARTLLAVRGSLADLSLLAPTVGEALLRVDVDEPLRAGLAEQVRELLPNAIEVRLLRPDGDGDARPSPAADRTPIQLVDEYLAGQGIVDARVRTLFATLLDEVTGAGV